MQFKVTERQVRIVAYFVEADSEEHAREHVQMLGCNEYNDEIEIEGTDIIEVRSI